MRIHKSTRISKQQSANESFSANKRSESKNSHFVAPVVLSRYRNFKLTNDGVKSRTFKVINKSQGRNSEVDKLEREVLKTERNSRDQVKQLRERINEYTVKRRSRNESSNEKNESVSNPKLVNSKFIIKSKSNILTKFDVSREREFLSNLTESRIERKKPVETREEMEETRKGWARIMKCLEF